MDTVFAIFRPMFIEDLGTSDTFAQTTATVLGAGSGATVTPLVKAANDAAAAAAGVPVGAVYVRSDGAFPYLATRMS